MEDHIVKAALDRLYQMQCDMLSDIETVASALEQPEPRREWRGLTYEEIQSIHDDTITLKRMGRHEFARAIEAALKERNA